jgi:hypothetical protein
MNLLWKIGMLFVIIERKFYYLMPCSTLLLKPWMFRDRIGVSRSGVLLASMLLVYKDETLGSRIQKP